MQDVAGGDAPKRSVAGDAGGAGADAAAVERRRVLFSGRVQGVGFRVTAVGVSRGRRVTGWVRNEPDGRVYLEAQGAPGEVSAYLADLRAAMERNIRSLDTAVIPPVEGEEGFEIRY